jgi:spore coat polysaccharide biosynthesis protein SpsF
MTKFKTEQEQFWANTFGDEYIDRNKDIHYISSNIALFAKILAKTKQVQSVIEFGANIGLNLLAIKQLLPKVELSAVEINQNAAAELKKIVKGATVYNQSILDLPTNVGGQNTCQC